jgi:hypothetical protein
MLKREEEVRDCLIVLSEKLSEASAAGDLANVNSEMREAFLHAFAFKNSPSHTIAAMDFLDVIRGYVDGCRMRSSSDQFARLGLLMKLIENTQLELYAYVDQIRANYLATNVLEHPEN